MAARYIENLNTNPSFPSDFGLEMFALPVISPLLGTSRKRKREAKAKRRKAKVEWRMANGKTVPWADRALLTLQTRVMRVAANLLQASIVSFSANRTCKLAIGGLPFLIFLWQ